MPKKTPSNPSHAADAEIPVTCTNQSCPEDWKHSTQEKSNSCVIASSRNIIKILTDKDVSEEDLRNETRDIMNKPDHDFDKNGINPAHAQTLLKNHGIETERKRNVAAEDLGTYTGKGKPIMIGFKNPGHRVILHSVTTDDNGKKTYMVRDPAPKYNGEMRKMSESDFKKKYNNQAIIIVPK